MLDNMQDFEVEAMTDRLEETIQEIREEKPLTNYPKSRYAMFKLLSTYYTGHCPTAKRIAKQLRCDYN